MNGTRTAARLVCGFIPVLLLLLAPAAFSQDSLGISIIRGQQTYDHFNDVAVLGDYLAVAAGTSGLLIIEEDDGEFTVVNQMQTPGTEVGVVEVNGNRMLTLDTYGIKLYSTVDPANPVQLAAFDYEVDLQFYYHDMIWPDRFEFRDSLLVRSSYSGVDVFSVTEQHAPARLDSLQMYERIRYLYSSRFAHSLCAMNALVDTLGNRALLLYDFNDPTNLEEVTLPDDACLDVDEFDLIDTRLLCKHDQMIALYDLSNLPAIQLLDEWTDPAVPDIDRLTLLEDYALASGENGTYYQFDIRNGELELVQTFTADWNASLEQQSAGNQVWLASATNGLQGFVLEDEEPGYEALNYDPVYALRYPVLLGETLVIGGESDSLRFYRHSNADELTLLGTWLPEGVKGAWVDAVSEDQALIRYTVPYPESITMARVQVITANPDAELGVDFRDTMVTPGLQFFDTYDDILVGYDNVAQNEEGVDLYFYDMSDPDNLSLLNTVRMDFRIYNIPVCHNRHIYAASSQGVDSRYRIIDFMDTQHPEVVLNGSVDDWGSYFSIFEGTLFQELEWQNNLYGVFSLADPGDPALMHEVELPWGASIGDKRWQYLLLIKPTDVHMSPSRVIDIFSLEEWQNDPLAIAWYTLPDYLLSVNFLEDNRIFANWGNGWGLFSCDDVGVGEEDNEPLPVAPELAMYPNPANPETRITLALPQTQQVSVCVFDVLGREVARLHAGVLQAGHHAFTFGSQPGLASGVYFVRAIAGQWETAQRIVLLK